MRDPLSFFFQPSFFFFNFFFLGGLISATLIDSNFAHSLSLKKKKKKNPLPNAPIRPLLIGQIRKIEFDKE
jgi:hypothetical protein